MKLILGFPIIGLVWTGLIYYFSNSSTFNLKIAYWIGGVGIVAGLLCLTSPMINILIWTLWNRLIAVIDTIITWSTLPIFYYIIFWPFALLIRFFGKATMRNWKRTRVTCWTDVPKNSSKKQYLRQF
jgi:uncharacterized membrane protein